MMLCIEKLLNTQNPLDFTRENPLMEKLKDFNNSTTCVYGYIEIITQVRGRKPSFRLLCNIKIA